MDRYHVTGMSCASCQARVEKAVSAVDGVDSCAVSLLTNSMRVEGTADPEKIIKAVEDAGYGAFLKMSGNTGNGASLKMSRDTGRTRPLQATRQTVLHDGGTGVSSDYDDLLTDTATPVMRRRLIASLVLLLPLMYVSMGHVMWNWPVPGFMDGNPVVIGIYEMLLSGFVMVVNQKFFINGFKGLLHKAPNMDTLVALGSVASFGYSVYALFAMSVAAGGGDFTTAYHYLHEFYFESAAMILTLITVGKMLEEKSKGRTTDAIKSLIKISPKSAIIIREGTEVTVPISQVGIGDLFVVKPGSAIPVDGIVREGFSAVNESAFTGESIPVEKTMGDKVLAATINTNGYMVCEATKIGEDTALSQVIRMVSDAAATKAPIAKIADRVSGIFVPTVILIAVLTFLVWLAVGQTFGYALARAISVLVISCPCALGLATPVAIMVGNGVGAKSGILFKTAITLEQTGKVQLIALDKTGTITTGQMQVTDIIPAGDLTASELLRLAASLEAKSEHPISKAITERAVAERAITERAITERAITERAVAEKAITQKTVAGRAVTYKEIAQETGTQRAINREEALQKAATLPIDWSEHAESENNLWEVTDFEAVAGNGLCGKIICELQEDKAFNHGLTIYGGKIYGGNAAYIIQSTGMDLSVLQKEAERIASEGKTPVYFATETKLLGLIAVADTIKHDSRRAIEQLKKLGLYVVMLTGDHETTAHAIAEEVGVDEVIASVKPDGKAHAIERMEQYGKVAMVGDGINDAPALTRADVGIAIGAGTDIAIDAADIVLTKDSLMDVAAAIRISRATIRNIRENLFWAFLYNVIGIPLAAGCFVSAFGWTLNPMFGAAAMSLSSFCVVTNALRLNLLKPYENRRDRAQRKRSTFPENQTIMCGQEKRAAQEKKVPQNQKSGQDQTDKAMQEKKNDQEKKENRTMKITVKGMMCHHCEAHVKEALEQLTFVDEAVADHAENLVSLTTSGEVSEADLKAAVENAGYEYVGIV